jgi:hypothetical protein
MKRKRRVLQEDDKNKSHIEQKVSTLFKTNIVNSINKESFSLILAKKHSFLTSFELNYPEMPILSSLDCSDKISYINFAHSISNSFSNEIMLFKMNYPFEVKAYKKLKTVNFFNRNKMYSKGIKTVVGGSYRKEISGNKYSQPKSNSTLKNSISQANLNSNLTVSLIPKISIKTALKKSETKIKINPPRFCFSTSHTNFKTTFKNFLTYRKSNKKNMLNIRIERESMRSTSMKREVKHGEGEYERKNSNVKSPTVKKKTKIKVIRTENFKEKRSSSVFSPDKKLQDNVVKGDKSEKFHQKSRNAINSSLKKENLHISDPRIFLSTRRLSSVQHGSNISSAIDFDKKPITNRNQQNRGLEIIPEVNGMKASSRNNYTPRKKNDDKKKIFAVDKSKLLINNSRTPDIKLRNINTNNLPSLNINVNFHVNLNVLNTDKISELNDKANEFIKSNFNNESIGENEDLFVISELNEKTPRNICYSEPINVSTSKSPKHNSKFQEKVASCDMNGTKIQRNEKIMTERDRKSLKINTDKKVLINNTQHQKSKQNNVIIPSLKKTPTTMSRNKLNNKKLFLFSERDDQKISSSIGFYPEKILTKKHPETQQSFFHQNKTFTNLVSPKVPKMANKIHNTSSKIPKLDLEKIKSIKINPNEKSSRNGKPKDLSIITKLPNSKVYTCNTVTHSNNNKIKIEFKKSLKEAITPTSKLKFGTLKAKTSNIKK